MKEKILSTKKNGMAILLLLLAAYIAAIGMVIFGGINMDSGNVIGIPIFVIGLIWVCIGWIFFCGLKVLKPQEALVLTLFGKYVGTLKNEGLYYVNPFCSGVNPAANTKLSQSGDVDNHVAEIDPTVARETIRRSGRRGRTTFHKSTRSGAYRANVRRSGG